MNESLSISSLKKNGNQCLPSTPLLKVLFHQHISHASQTGQKVIGIVTLFKIIPQFITCVHSFIERCRQLCFWSVGTIVVCIFVYVEGIGGSAADDVVDEIVGGQSFTGWKAVILDHVVLERRRC